MFFATHPRDLVIYPLIPFMIGFYLYHKNGGLDWLFLAFGCQVLEMYIAFVISGRFFSEFKTDSGIPLDDTQTPQIPTLRVNGHTICL